MLSSKIAKIFAAISLCLLVGFTTGLTTTEAIPTWYINLEKPFFNLPNSLFAPAWLLFLILNGTAAGIIWHKGLSRDDVISALLFFIFQLIISGLWTVLFFGLKNIDLSFGAIVILFILVSIMGLKFYRIERLAGLLIVPFILWIAFALILNGAICWLN